MPDVPGAARPTPTGPADLCGAALSVGLLVGRPPDGSGASPHCGVRDYAGQLAGALSASGVAARVIAPPDWGVLGGPALARALRAERFDILHLQYPSLGHRRSLLPHMLGLERDRS